MSLIPCGLTAKTTASGTSVSASTPGAACVSTPAPAASVSGTPAGSTTTYRDAAPPASQPRSMAEPIWPQPTRTIVPALIKKSPRSGFADWIDHRRRHRLVGRLAAPHDELERRVEALAFGDRDVDDILDLLAAQRGEPAQQHRIAEGRRIIA